MVIVKWGREPKVRCDCSPQRGVTKSRTLLSFEAAVGAQSCTFRLARSPAFLRWIHTSRLPGTDPLGARVSERQITQPFRSRTTGDDSRATLHHDSETRRVVGFDGGDVFKVDE